MSTLILKVVSYLAGTLCWILSHHILLCGTDLTVSLRKEVSENALKIIN